MDDRMKRLEGLILRAKFSKELFENNLTEIGGENGFLEHYQNLSKIIDDLYELLGEIGGII